MLQFVCISNTGAASRCEMRRLPHVYVIISSSSSMTSPHMDTTISLPRYATISLTQRRTICCIQRLMNLRMSEIQIARSLLHTFNVCSHSLILAGRDSMTNTKHWERVWPTVCRRRFTSLYAIPQNYLLISSTPPQWLELDGRLSDSNFEERCNCEHSRFPPSMFSHPTVDARMRNKHSSTHDKYTKYCS